MQTSSLRRLLWCVFFVLIKVSNALYKTEHQIVPVSQQFQRSFLSKFIQISSAVSSVLLLPSIGKCLEQSVDSVGVDQTGLFALCPGKDTFLSSCVSSQDDRPSFFLNPWCYEGTYPYAKRKLLDKIVNLDGATIKKSPEENDRLISVEFLNSDHSIDDTEFYFTPNDTTIQFRSLRRQNKLDFGMNRKRLESIRIALGFEFVPILRNRRRTFVFVESPFDTFGPPTIEFDKIIDDISGDSLTPSPPPPYPQMNGNPPQSSILPLTLDQCRGVIAELNPYSDPLWELDFIDKVYHKFRS